MTEAPIRDRDRAASFARACVAEIIDERRLSLLAVKVRDPRVAWLILGLLHRGLTAGGWRGPVRFS